MAEGKTGESMAGNHQHGLKKRAEKAWLFWGTKNGNSESR